MTKLVEQQRTTCCAERQISKLIEDDEIEEQQPLSKLAGFVLGVFLLEHIDQIDGGEEPDFLAVMLDDLDTERGVDVRLARAGSADQHEIVGAVDELAAVELADHGFVDLLAAKSMLALMLERP